MTSGPALLPSLEELQAGYDGSGTYEVSEGVLLRQFDVGGTVVTKAERYIREEDCLILGRGFWRVRGAVPGSVFPGTDGK